MHVTNDITPVIAQTSKTVEEYGGRRGKVAALQQLWALQAEGLSLQAMETRLTQMEKSDQGRYR